MKIFGHLGIVFHMVSMVEVVVSQISGTIQLGVYFQVAICLSCKELLEWFVTVSYIYKISCFYSLVAF